MNEYINYVEGEVGQSSKGHWYCKSLIVSNSNVGKFIADTDSAIERLEIILDKYNQDKPEEKERDG